MAPKEHGSWGMFFIPLLLGLIAAGRPGVAGLLFVVAATAAFFAREPLMTAWRGWRRKTGGGRAGHIAIGCGLFAAILGLPLLFVYGRYWLLVIAAAAGGTVVWHAERAMRGKGRSVTAELVAIAASMLTAPAGVYAVSGQWRPGWELWAVCTLYFASSVFYVKMRVTAAHQTGKPAAKRTRSHCAAYHLLLTAGLFVLPAAIGFVPVIARALYYVLRPTTQLNLRRVGWTEVAYSLFFIAVVAWTYAQFARSTTVWGS